MNQNTFFAIATVAVLTALSVESYFDNKAKELVAAETTKQAETALKITELTYKIKEMEAQGD